jgi:hypothetical protein
VLWAVCPLGRQEDGYRRRDSRPGAPGSLKGQRHEIVYGLFVRWAGKKRDIVDEVLVGELQVA